MSMLGSLKKPVNWSSWLAEPALFLLSLPPSFLELRVRLTLHFLFSFLQRGDFLLYSLLVHHCRLYRNLWRRRGE